MRRSRRLSRALTLVAVLTLSLGAASCGGGGGGGGNSDLVLIGFNVPNIAGIPLNQPLIFTFSNDIDPISITPDTLRVTGALGPFFETTVVDGNLVALLPRSPNFEDYSDAGMAPATRYTVSFAKFPAPDTIRTPDGKPLLDAESFEFTTTPAPVFIEPRRPINRGAPPSTGGRSDDEGCLQNPDNALYDASKQFGSGVGARLLCLKNEGSPRIILSECAPTHNDTAVGTPSAVTPGTLNLPAIRVRFNEPLDPVTVVPYIPTAKRGLNVQLWRVGDTDKVPIPPEQIRTNKPLIVQSLNQTEIILVAANEDEFGNPIGGVPQGTYMINVTAAVSDLPGNTLVTSDRPSASVGGFTAVEQSVDASGAVPPGYRIYFVTLALPGTAQSFNETYGTNLLEWGDVLSGNSEPGVLTRSSGTALLDPIPGTNVPSPSHTLMYTFDGAGQSTSANWNNGFRFLGIDSLEVNTDIENGQSRLKAVWKPYLGDGMDGNFDSGGGGAFLSIGTDVVPGNSVNGDGIYEFESFNLRAGDTLNVSGANPLVILCRGAFTVAGTINLNGQDGRFGLDTDGTAAYTDPGSIPAVGIGGVPGPGGGAGGAGGDPLLVVNGGGLGDNGAIARTVFGALVGSGGMGGEGGVAPLPEGGGGGGFGSTGFPGLDTTGADGLNGGLEFGDTTFSRLLSLFTPDRTYSPNANGSGGSGGAGGGVRDDPTQGTLATVDNGDDAGGGGGGGGGGIYVLAGDTVTVSGSIIANGGNGGHTYAVADQVIDLGDDGQPGGSDLDADFVTGIANGATPSGNGGPGGGGSGGGIFLMGRAGVSFTGTMNAEGGLGGECGDPDMVGGEGGLGRITLAAPATATITDAGTATPLLSQVVYNPTVDLVSAAQSHWFDMFTNGTDFDPPFWDDNFGNLLSQGLVQGLDYDVVLEFQGADNLTPLPGGVTPPTTAVGLTAWSASIDDIDMKRYIRYRWRFMVGDTYPGTTQSMPAIVELTIPFRR